MRKLTAIFDTVHRTLIDLGAVAGADVVEAAMESALRRRMTTIERLEARMGEIGGRGRRGAGVLRRVLAGREPGTPPTDSGLETQFVQLLRRGRLPQPSRQQVVRDESGLVARVDFEYLGRDIVIEGQSQASPSDEGVGEASQAAQSAHDPRQACPARDIPENENGAAGDSRRDPRCPSCDTRIAISFFPLCAVQDAVE